MSKSTCAFSYYGKKNPRRSFFFHFTLVIIWPEFHSEDRREKEYLCVKGEIRTRLY